jgi:serine protease Do
MTVFLFLLSTVAFGLDELKLDKYQRMSYRVKPSVVKIWAQVQGTVAYETDQGKKIDENNIIGGSGSGFVVNPNGYVVTNGHVVKTIYEFNTNKDLVANQILMEFLQKTAQQNNMQPTEENIKKLMEKLKPQVVDLQPQNFVILSNLKDYRFEIKKYSKSITEGAKEKGGEGKDIAILKIEGKNLPTVRLGDSDKVKLQELVFAFGYPGAADIMFVDFKSKFSEVSITRGTVSAVKADFKGVPIIQSDVAISWGNSGGPSVNENGEVIGANTYIGIAQGQAVGGFSFLIPVNTVKEFVNAEGIKEESSLFNEIYFQALEKVWAKEWFEARDLLNKALVFIPEQPDIIKLRMDVETAITRTNWFTKNWQRNKIAMISMGIIILLIIGVGVTLMMRKKPQPVKEPVPLTVQPEAGTKVEGKTFGALTLSTNGQLGKSYPIGEKGLIIGREVGQCDIVISDINVSRIHAWITVEKGEVVVIDRGSTNGTFVNNNKVEKAKLKPGDVIHLGQKCMSSLVFNK